MSFSALGIDIKEHGTINGTTGLLIHLLNSPAGISETKFCSANPICIGRRRKKCIAKALFPDPRAMAEMRLLLSVSYRLQSKPLKED